MTETLRAFHGDAAIKAKYVARVEAHRAADRLIHGVYWEDGKGCAVGCTIEGSEHAAAAARHRHYVTMSEKLLRLLRAADA